MPPMTYALGPVFVQTGVNFPNTLRQISITAELIRQLPPASYVSFRLHGEITNTLAFETAGFSALPDYTVEIAPNSIETLWRGMRSKTRNVIRRAQEKLKIIEYLDPKIFLAFYQSNLNLQHKKNFYDQSICENLIDECLRRDVGRIIATVNSDNELQSAIFTVWDHKSEYYLMSTRIPDSINGSTSLAIWTAIQHSASMGLTFDMAGIHVHQHHLPNLALLTGFGGTIKPRYKVQRATRLVKIIRKFQKF